MNKLWICGQLKGEWKAEGSVWEFQGVFSSMVRAKAACVSETYFFFPATLDSELPEESFSTLDGCYPRAVFWEDQKRFDEYSMLPSTFFIERLESMPVVEAGGLRKGCRKFLKILNPFIWILNTMRSFSHLDTMRFCDKYEPYDFENDLKYF